MGFHPSSHRNENEDRWEEGTGKKKKPKPKFSWTGTVWRIPENVVNEELFTSVGLVNSSMGCVKCLTLGIYSSTIWESLVHFVKQMLVWDCLGTAWVSLAPTDNSRDAVRSIPSQYFAGKNQDLHYSTAKVELFFPFSFSYILFAGGRLKAYKEWIKSCLHFMPLIYQNANVSSNLAINIKWKFIVLGVDL